MFETAYFTQDSDDLSTIQDKSIAWITRWEKDHS